jgi:large subunit ribosomal protein L3
VTVKNLKVVRVDEENDLLYLRGAVPGPRNGLLGIRRSKRG